MKETLSKTVRLIRSLREEKLRDCWFQLYVYVFNTELVRKENFQMFLDLGSLLHLLSRNTRCSVLDEEVEGEASPALLTGEVRGGEDRGGSMAAGLTFVWPPPVPPASEWGFLAGWSPHINTDWLQFSLFKASIVSEFRLIWRCRLEMHWPDLLEDDLYW